MKTCSDCGLVKPFEAFVAKPSCKDGVEPRCRQCRTIKYNKSTPDLLCKKIFRTQVLNSIKREQPLPAYSVFLLAGWIQAQPEFEPLYAAWKASGWEKDLAPSVDRKDDSLPYTLGNIQLMTWAQNRAKAAQSKKDNTLLVNHRPVAAYTRDGKLYKEYQSMAEAMRELGGKATQSWGISSVCNGTPVKDGRGKLYTPQTYKGYVWKWND